MHVCEYSTESVWWSCNIWVLAHFQSFSSCASHAQNITQCLSIHPAASIPYSDILCILFQPLPSAWQPTLSQTLLSMRPSCLSVCLSACPSVCPSSFLHSLNSSLGLLLLPASALPAQCPTPISDNTPFFRIIWGEMKVKKKAWSQN